MNRLRNLRPILKVVVLLGAILGWLSGSEVFSSEPLSLTIIHVNDTHSQIEPLKEHPFDINGISAFVDAGGMPRVASMVKKIRSERKNTILLHAGDAVQGTLYFTEYGGEAEFTFLNKIGFDAMAIGNHEFDRGPANLAKMVGYADFPAIATNIDTSKEPSLDGKFKRFTIMDVGGQNIGIIGITTVNTPFMSSPGDKVIFNDEKRAAIEYTQKLERMGIDKIIALTHLGYEQDMALARSVSGIDIIVGGHSHTLLGSSRDLEKIGLNPEGDYPSVVKNPDGEKVYIVQAWAKSAMVGLLDVVFDGRGEVTSASGKAMLMVGRDFKMKDKDGNMKKCDKKSEAAIMEAVKSCGSVEVVDEDREALDLLATFCPRVKNLRHKVIGRASADLYHIRVPSDRPVYGVNLSKGSYIAPHVAESMLWRVNSNGVKNADLALKGGGGVRRDILKGDITVASAYELLPFINTLVIVELSGAELKQSIQSGVTNAIAGSSSGAYPYLAGASYSIDTKSDPGHPLVTSVEIKDKSGSYTAVDDSSYYRIVVDSFIAEGGDFYTTIAKASRYRYDTEFTDVEAFIDYVKSRGTIGLALAIE